MENFDYDMEYKRDKYLNRLKERQHNGLIKIITGARRTGKSYLLNELYYRSLLNSGVPAEHIIRFAFDADEDLDLLDPYFPGEETRKLQRNRLYFVNSKKFRAFIKEKTDDNHQFYLLLDEIQLLENFAGTLNSFLRHRNFDICVTGSNSRLLSSDIATEFKGRGTIVHMHPLTFSEYTQNSAVSTAESWSEYIETGGIPLVAQMKSKEEKISYLKGLCEETYLKDIAAHNAVKKQTELADTFDILASMIGTPVNTLNLANTFKSVLHKDISDDTIANFTSYFEDAFVVSKARKYSVKGRKYIGSPYKIYFEDIGVRNARLNFRQVEETHIMENIIYNELRYRGFNVDIGEVSVSEKTDRTDKNGRSIYMQKALEVDFIATLGSRKYYLQSALSMDAPGKQAQEKRSLYGIDDSFKKIVITKNGLKPSIDERGVLTLDLFSFLLNDDSLERE